MSGTVRARWASLAVLAALLAGSCALARAGSPPVGGTVSSTLELSLGEPSAFRRTGAARRGDVYTATLPAAVTATDAPARLSIRGGGDASFMRTLRSWSEPVSLGAARVRLRTVARSARALRNEDRLFVVTLTAGGP